MGLLDGLLGQVLGGMAQQRGGGGGGLDDLLNQIGGNARGAPGGGGLGDLLNQMGGGSRGAPGGGGLGDLLNQMGGGGMPTNQAGGGMGGAVLGGLLMIALQMLQRNGGLGNVLGKLQAQGYGREADSWVSSGDNVPVSADVIEQIFGRDAIGQAAQQMGLSPEQATGGLAQIFPEIVNEMTPQGRIEPGSDDVVAQAMEILQRAGK
jgi:uncharacterized protein YidB (DUF937 family)